MSIQTDVLSGLKWTVLGRVATQAVTWGLTIYVMRLLKPDDYGLMALASIFNALLVMLSEMGLGSALIRSKELSSSRIQQLFGIVLLSNGGACLLMATILAPLVAAFFAIPTLQLVLQVISLQFLPAAFSVIPAALLQREMKFRGRVIADVVSGIGSALTVIILARLEFGVFALAWGGFAQSAIRSVILIFASPYPGKPLFNFTGCGNLFDFGRNVAQTQLVWFFYSQADSFIIGKTLGKYPLGLYSVAMDLAALPASRISAILNQIITPALSKVQRDGGTVGPYVLKGLRSLSLISFPIMWGMSSVSSEMVRGLLGEKWADAIIPITLLCLIMPLRVLSPLLHSGLYSVGRADISFRITCLTALALCSAFLVGTQFGLIGVSLAWVIVFPAVFLFNLFRSCKYVDLSVRETAGTLLRPVSAAGLMYACVEIVRHFLPWPALANLVALVAVGAISYFVFTILINRAGLLEALNMFRRKQG